MWFGFEVPAKRVPQEWQELQIHHTSLSGKGAISWPSHGLMSLIGSAPGGASEQGRQEGAVIRYRAATFVRFNDARSASASGLPTSSKFMRPANTPMPRFVRMYLVSPAASVNSSLDSTSVVAVAT